MRGRVFSSPIMIGIIVTIIATYVPCSAFHSNVPMFRGYSHPLGSTTSTCHPQQQQLLLLQQQQHHHHHCRQQKQHHSRFHNLPLAFAPDPPEGDSANLSDDDDDNNKNKEEIVKAEMSEQYRLTTFVNIGASLILLFSPDKTRGILRGAKIGGALGYIMASAICTILRGATINNRLKSDTYKRLNVGLLGFASLSLIAIPSEAGFFPKRLGVVPKILTLLVLTVTRMANLLTAWKGWTKGVNGWLASSSSSSGMMKEFMDGMSSTLDGLEVKNIEATDYRRLLLLLVGGGFIFNIVNLVQSGLTPFHTSLALSAMGRLFLLSTIVFSLKDAAERDRLTGTTFIQMHFLIFAWATIIGCTVPFEDNLLGPAPLMLSYAFPFFLKGCLSIWEKRRGGEEV